MDTLKYLAKKFKFSLPAGAYVDLPNLGQADLAKLFAELGFSKGAQVGTWQADYSAQLCAANPKLNLIGIDIDSSTPRRNIPDNCKLVRMSSLDAAKRVVDESLDFVYLDINDSLTPTLESISAWSKKVRKGGVIAGHDFFRFRPQSNLHTRQAVLAYTSTYKISPLIITGQNKERVRSWFWVKA